MENKLQVFNNKEFGEIQIIRIDNKEYFGATSVAKSLGYNNPHDAISRHCKKDGVVKHEVIDNLNRKQIMNFITEGNLYRLITKSKLPSAENFESWVFDEVLPQIRKTGGYIPQNENDSDEDIMARALIIAQRTIENKNKLIAEKEKQIEEQRPLVAFAETCIKSSDNILVRQLAKIANDEGIKIGEKRLYTKMREWNLIMKNSTEPYQTGMERGYFVVEEKSVNTPYGVKLTKTTKVCPKGQVYIIEKLKKELV